MDATRIKPLGDRVLVKEKKAETKEKKIIVDEENEEISIGFSTFKKYFGKYNGGLLFVFAMNLCMFVFI